MYAIIRTGGKQYTVKPGDTLRIEKLPQELGKEFDLPEVLMLGGDNPTMGEPLVSDAKVTAVVTRQAKAPKVIVFKKKRRQGYRRLKGHRQLFTEIFIKSIAAGGQIYKAETEAQVVDPAKKEERLAKIKEEMKDKKVAKEKKDKKKAASAAKKAKTKKKATKKKKSTGKKKAAKKKTAKKKTKKVAKKAAKKKTTKK